MRKSRRIRISEALARAIEAHLPELSATSVSDFVESTLQEQLRAKGLLPALTPEEEREVEQRLRDLGYLD